jgi:hypothetical protein
MLSILRYGNEVREAEPYFERLTTKKPDTEPVALALERISGRFEPEKMPDEYARAVKELVKTKVEHRAPASTSWMRLRLVCRSRGNPRCAMPCASEWAKVRLKRHRLDPQHAVAQSIGAACTKLFLGPALQQMKAQTSGAFIRSANYRRGSLNGEGPEPILNTASELRFPKQ